MHPAASRTDHFVDETARVHARLNLERLATTYRGWGQAGREFHQSRHPPVPAGAVLPCDKAAHLVLAHRTCLARSAYLGRRRTARCMQPLWPTPSWADCSPRCRAVYGGDLNHEEAQRSTLCCLLQHWGYELTRADADAYCKAKGLPKCK